MQLDWNNEGLKYNYKQVEKDTMVTLKKISIIELKKFKKASDESFKN